MQYFRQKLIQHTVLSVKLINYPNYLQFLTTKI